MIPAMCIQNKGSVLLPAAGSASARFPFEKTAGDGLKYREKIRIRKGGENV